jgi:hypothetical protein
VVGFVVRHDDLTFVMHKAFVEYFNKKLNKRAIFIDNENHSKCEELLAKSE